MSELDEVDLPFWVIILIVVLALGCLFCCCTCFVVRCFAPENTKGPAWEINTEGYRWVRPFTWDSWLTNWMAYETDDCPYLKDNELSPDQVCSSRKKKINDDDSQTTPITITISQGAGGGDKPRKVAGE